jgi:hypothetical protein
MVILAGGWKVLVPAKGLFRDVLSIPKVEKSL